MVPPAGKLNGTEKSTRVFQNTMPGGRFPHFLSHAAVSPTLPSRIWSAPGGNEHATYRDVTPLQRPFFKEYHPPAGEEADGISRGTVHLYAGPGNGVSNADKRRLATYPPRLRDRAIFPQRIEIEFSAPPSVFPCSNGTPEDFRKSAIDWALDLCPAVALCLDWQPGTAAGEAYAVLGELQVTFRCPERLAGVWEAFLRKRLRPRHRFAVVQSVAGQA